MVLLRSVDINHLGGAVFTSLLSSHLGAQIVFFSGLDHSCPVNANQAGFHVVHGRDISYANASTG